MTKILTIIITLNVLVITAFPQATSSGTVSATVIEPMVVKPINIATSVTSDDRNIAVILAGSVYMSTLGEHSKTGSIALPVSSGTFTAGSFYTSGSTGYTYTFTVPSSPLTITSGSKKMTVNSFESDRSVRSEPGLVAGIYVTVTPFNVTVNYN